MKSGIAGLILFLCGCFSGLQAQMKVSADIEVKQLSDKVYGYVSAAEIPGWGRVPSNGLILVEGGEAFLFDTPLNDQQTRELVEWIRRDLKAKVIGFVPNHWHGDCMGGLGYLHKIGVKSYASQMTIELARAEGKPVPQQGFTDSLHLKLGQTPIACYYLGGGHSTDNIVVWLPSEKILFGGCMLKDVNTQSLGNLSDAVVDEWPLTIERVMKKFPDAKVVVPGHGPTGGIDVLKHTLNLLLKK